MVGYLAERLGVEAVNVAHVALLPAPLAAEVGALSVATVTWERLTKTYADVAPPYFLEVLRFALARYEKLAAPHSTFGANAEIKLTGAEIYERHRGGTLTVPWMGRKGGLFGAELAQDIASGMWRGWSYECSSKSVEHPNWFTVTDFAIRIEAASMPP